MDDFLIYLFFGLSGFAMVLAMVGVAGLVFAYLAAPPHPFEE